MAGAGAVTSTGDRPARSRLSTVVGIALGAIAGGAAMLFATRHISLAPAADGGMVLRETNAVIVAVRDLAVLQTTSYHIERVIDLRDRQSHLFGLFESEDAVLLVAAADIAAGVDLGLLGRDDIVIDPERRVARVRLPPPAVISVRLDNDSTYVHTRSTDALAVRAKTLETRARQEAERALERAALDAGILHRARENAARTVKALVQSLGYSRVEVEFPPD
jgi:hypothetical protein